MLSQIQIVVMRPVSTTIKVLEEAYLEMLHHPLYSSELVPSDFLSGLLKVAVAEPMFEQDVS